jgi:hypothetical protein
MCYSAVTQITCPGPDENYFGQDAHYGWDLFVAPDQRFLKSEPVNGQPVVYDNFTATQWQGCPAGLTGGSCNQGSVSPKTWSGAISYCNTLDWGGYDDWRLPAIEELLKIVDAGSSKPAIDMGTFPGTPSQWFWTSTVDQSNPQNSAWYVDFNYGSTLTYYQPDNTTRAVRCVRGATASAADFSKNLNIPDEPVVSHNNTGLMWQGCLAGQSGEDCTGGSLSSVVWKSSLRYCNTLNWGGYDDWRLPNRNELLSIVDFARGLPSINPTVFPNTPSESCWTSTTQISDPSYGWLINFGYGRIDYASKPYVYRVRCVRGGV